MAQVMVNFRMDEALKKSMEQACKEMGLSMTAAFTIFATKVSKEKRIPFEITAEPYIPQRTCCLTEPQNRKEEKTVLPQKQKQLELLCGEIRRSLTSVHTAIPSSITGLAMERIRLLCGDELKDKAAGVSSAVRNLFSSRNAEALKEKDLTILEEYLDGLSSIAEELRELERTLAPSMKSWSGGDTSGFDRYERQLSGLSKKFDALPAIMQRFLHSTARRQGSASAVQARMQQAARPVETAYVLTALDNLEGLIRRHYDSLDDQTKAHFESYYLQTLELTLRELSLAEQNGEDPGPKAALCLRTVNVLSQVIYDQRQARQALGERGLEAEVAALERLAALRGDIAGDLKPE